MEESKSHGFTLAQLEKFVETVARTGSTDCHVHGDAGWVETRNPPVGVVAVRCFVEHGFPRFFWSNVFPGACIWHDFPSLERQAMVDAWYSERSTKPKREWWK